MALADTPRRAGPFFGNGAVTEFPFSFRVLEPGDLAVLRYDEFGFETVLTPGADYTLELSESGGTVTLAAPLATGLQLVLLGDAAYDQPLVLSNTGPFRAEDVMRALDRGAVQAQQLREKLNRAVLVPPTETGQDTTAFLAQLAATEAATLSARDDAESARDDAQSARDDAQSAQGAAESARDDAQSALGAAEGARDDAQSAQGAAESARDDAQSAQGSAESARDDAQSAQGAAESARDDAQSAQGAAESARDDAQSARDDAESARDDAQSAQGAAEGARDASVAARDKAEAWADNGEDVPVETGPDRFSAKHWSAKAEAAAASVGTPVPQARTITTEDGITGGGDLSQDRTFGLSQGGVAPDRLGLSQPALVGRSGAGAGAAEEVTIGSGLSLSAGILAATGGAVDYQVFTSSGTWTKPAGVSLVYVEVWGGGASGAVNVTASGNVGAPGGAGGMFVSRLFRASDLASFEAVTVGAGGASVSRTSSSGYTPGIAGGASSFAGMTATGGNPPGGTQSVPEKAPALVPGYFGGEGDDLLTTVQPLANTVFGGAGGGSGTGPTSSSDAPTSGGVSQHGGDGGAGASGPSTQVASAGSAPGGGGGGARTRVNGGSGTSGAGARGEVRIWAW